MIRPSDIRTDQHFWSAFDHAETEVSANWVVRFLTATGDTWRSFTHDEISAWAGDNGHKGSFVFNRLIHPGWSYGIRRGRYQAGGGWITDDNGVLTVTEDFINRCYKSSPKE